VPRFLPYFDDQTWVDYLYQDSDQNIWFSANNAIGVLRLQEDGSFKKISLPFLKLSNLVIPSFEHIHELDQNNVLIGIEGGFANYVPKYRKDYSRPCAIFISSLKSGDTTEGIYRYNSKKPSQTLVPEFRHRHNTVSISYSANNFESPEVLFQYRLLGFDEKWSEWTTKTFKEYTNLPSGHYTFMLRASNNELTTPTELSYKFIVLAPWYGSVYAIVLYLIVGAILIYLGKRYLVYRIEQKHLAEKQLQKERYLALEQKHNEEALITEKEVERLRNDALRLEMVHKEKELANSTMLLIQKNNILTKLQTDLQAINASLPNDSVKNSIKNLIKRIEKEIDNEKQWKVFDMHIEQVYEDLFKKLKESYPDLTPRELSLCAYLRMNISSKEIATLMNISARGVEISRYRVRKKLKLDRDDNLTEFMLNL
jgi:DNA-binding CsgD family transcriptional regulator